MQVGRGEAALLDRWNVSRSERDLAIAIDIRLVLERLATDGLFGLTAIGASSAKAQALSDAVPKVLGWPALRNRPPRPAGRHHAARR